MFNRENAIGILLLGLCLVSAAVMAYYIGVGEYPSFNIPGPVKIVLSVLFIGLIIVGILRSPLLSRMRGGQGGPQWPNPGTGQKSLWDRLRGK